MTRQTSVRRSLTVPGRPEQAAAARDFVAGAVGEGSSQADAAVLLVSELVTNSVLHSLSGCDGGAITVTVIAGPGEFVRVEVTDEGAATLPVVRAGGGDDDENGRGMQLVSALASAWSCYRQGSRTTTWFELASGSVTEWRCPAGMAASMVPVRGGHPEAGPGLPEREPVMAPAGRCLSALRAELASCGVAVEGMAITRWQGSLVLAGGRSVRYLGGWFFWPLGRPSRAGRPMYAVHRAGDPAGAARRLASRQPAMVRARRP